MAETVAQDMVEELVLVTGAGSGVGRALCQQLSTAGATVIITDIDLQSAQETKNADQHLVLQMDVSSSDSVRQAAEEVERRFHRAPSGVVHCAAIVIVNETRQSSLDCKEEEWDRVISVNLKGTFLVDTIFAQLMKKRKVPHGSIVNVVSLARRGYPPFIDYSASKAGVVGITKTLSKELGPFNIRVNAVAPSMILTPMLLKTATEEFLKKSAHSCPLRRLAEADEVASVCMFLLRPKCSSYVNGEIINVDGGETGLPYRFD